MTVEAVYSGGVFKPLEKVDIRENERVVLDFAPMHVTPQSHEVEKWLETIRVLQKQIVVTSGILPDSTAELAEDRLR